MNALSGAATLGGRFGFGMSVQFVMASLNMKLAIATMSMPCDHGSHDGAMSSKQRHCTNSSAPCDGAEGVQRTALCRDQDLRNP